MNNLVNQIKNIYEKKKDEYVDSLGHSQFKKEVSLEKRKEQSQRIMVKYPNRLPIICDVSKKLPELDRHKYLIPEDLKVGEFMCVIRKRLKLRQEEAIYFFIKNKLLTGNRFMSEMYDKYKDEDGLLYVYVCAENTFG